ncbi:hypothetical protein D3C76_1627170 [compost metagenome]
MGGVGDLAEAELADDARQAHHQPDEHHHQHALGQAVMRVGRQPLIEPDIAEQPIQHARQATKQARPAHVVLG